MPRIVRKSSTVGPTTDEDGYFGESVAEPYDESSAETFEAGAVDAAVEVRS